MFPTEQEEQEAEEEEEETKSQDTILNLILILFIYYNNTHTHHTIDTITMAMTMTTIHETDSEIVYFPRTPFSFCRDALLYCERDTTERFYVVMVMLLLILCHI